MIAEQLQAARAAHWRQQNNPLLTLEDAERWLAQHPLCLFLPRRAQLPAPAPSFVEACLGSTQATPDPAAIEHAQALLARLTAAGTVVPLNLLGTASEQPDFLATREALPFVISLRAEADWKRAPQTSSGRRVSPLVIELWKLLDEKGSLTAEEARDALGRELTEAAVLRALAELWQGLRISPVYGEQGQPARWEMMQLRHKDALTTAAGTGQVTALSLLVSMYLQSVYAATSEEIEIFFSPAASRSRAREAVRGLSATRQIHSLSMGAQTYYFLKDGLPEFATVVVAEAEEPAAEPPAVRPRKRDHPLTPPPGAIESKPETRPEAPAARGGWQRPQRAGGEKFRPRPQGDERRSAAAGGPRPWRPKETADPSAPLRSGRDDKEREGRPGGFRRDATSPRPGATGEGRPSFKPRSGPPRAGGAPPRREGSEGRPSFKPRSGPPRAGGAPPRRDSGEGRPPFKPRSGPPRAGGAPPRRDSGEGRPPFKPRSGPPRAGGAPPRRDSGEGRLPSSHVPDLQEQVVLRRAETAAKADLRSSHVPDLQEQEALRRAEKAAKAGLRSSHVPDLQEQVVLRRAEKAAQAGLPSSHARDHQEQEVLRRAEIAVKADLPSSHARDHQGQEARHAQRRRRRQASLQAALGTTKGRRRSRVEIAVKADLPSSRARDRQGQEVLRAEIAVKADLRSSHGRDRHEQVARRRAEKAAKADLVGQDGRHTSAPVHRNRGRAAIVPDGPARRERGLTHDRPVSTALGSSYRRPGGRGQEHRRRAHCRPLRPA